MWILSQTDLFKLTNVSGSRWYLKQFYVYFVIFKPLNTYMYCGTGRPFILVISEHPWHSHLLPNVLQWSCHHMFLWLRSVAAVIWTPNLPLARPTLSPTAPPPRCLELNLIKIFTEYHVRFFIYNPDHEYPTFEIILMRSQLSVIFRNLRTQLFQSSSHLK